MAAEYLIRLRPIALTFFALAATLPCVLAAKGVAPGPYECWFYNTPQPLKNFTLKDGTYSASR